jgi:transcriptional regulator with XRE-family HTH domain
MSRKKCRGYDNEVCTNATLGDIVECTTETQAKKLGKLLVRTRERAGLSLRGLAEQADIPYTWLARIEQGTFTHPAPDRLARVAEALGIDPARIDRLSHNHLADSLPSLHTYFRSKEKASPEEIAEIEAAIKKIHSKYERRETV